MTTTLPAAMVDAAARLLYDLRALQGAQPWESIQDTSRNVYRNQATAILTAALAGCHVEQTWRIRLDEPNEKPAYTAWYGGSPDQARAVAELAWWANNPGRTLTLQHRVTIISEPTDVPPTRS